MKTWLATAIGGFMLAITPATAAPVGTELTYQGQLKVNGVPYDGLADVRFSLWTDLLAGSQVGSTLERNNVDVVHGLFTVDDLDFTAGSFAGEARYLQVAVKAPAGVGSFVPVSPRQPITPTPYAMHAIDAPVGHSLDASDGSPVNALAVNAAGDVGIGTTSPEADIHIFRGSAGAISANGNAPLVVESNTHAYINILAADANESGVLFGRPGSAIPTAAGGILFNSPPTTDGLQFRNGGNQIRMVLDSTGNLGLGTTSPAGRLHIVGAAAPPFGPISDNGLLLGSNGSAAYKWIQSYNGALSLNPLGNNVGVGTSTPTARLHVGGTPGVDGIKFPDSTLQTTAAPDGHSLNAADGSPVDAVFVNNSGQVGIGTTTPGFPLTFPNVLGDKISLWGQSGSHYGFGIQSSLLQVHTDSSGSDIAFGFGSSAAFTESMRIKGTGSVGIGTTSPLSELHLFENSGTARIRVESADGQAGISFVSDSTVENVIYSPDASDDLRFFVNSADRMAITSSGNVGVGTNSPSEKLVVSGNVQVTGEVRRPSTGAANMVPLCYGHVDNTGAVHSGSGNFTAVWDPSFSRYAIQVSGEDFTANTLNPYTVLVTPIYGYRTSLGTYEGKLVVEIHDTFGSVQQDFSFLIFKP